MVLPLFPSCRRRQLGQTESGARWSSLLPAGAQMMQPGPTSGFLQGSGFPSEDPHYRPKEETTYEKTRTTIGRPAGSPLKIP